MEQTHLHRFLMNIHLSDRDIAQMPESLRNEFLDWLPESLKTKNLRLDPVPVPQQDETFIPNRESQIPEENSDNTHVRLTQLFDAGITKRGMPVRVKLKRKLAKKLSRE